MSLKKRIAANMSFVGAGEAISSVLSLVLSIIIARTLGAEGLGIYSFAFAFVGLFVVFYDFGVSTFFIKEAARDPKDAQAHFGNYASLKLVFCLVAMILPMITILFLKRGYEVTLIVYLGALSVFFQNYSYSARNAFQAFQQMKYDAYIRIIERLIAFALGAYILLHGYGLSAFMVVLVISNFVSLGSAVWLLRKVGLRFSLSFDTSRWKSILKVSWPFWLSAVFIQLYFYIDTVMLTFMKGYAETGIYNAAYKLISVLSKVPMLIVLVLFPVMSQLYAKLSKDLLRQALEKVVTVLIVLSVPLMIGVTLLSERLIRFVYKEGFADASVVLAILVWTAFFTFLSYMLGWFLNATNKHKYFALVSGICLFLNFSLNFLLIPTYSSVGASIATVATSVVNFFLLHFMVRKIGYGIPIGRMSIRPVLSGAVMGGFIFFFGAGIHLLVLIPISAIIYGGVLFTFGGISKDDMKGIV